MESLRTRKLQTSNGQSQKLSKQPSSASRKNTNVNARKSRIDDKIKKRMSMRYATISAPTDASVPDVPALPLSLLPGRGPGAQPSRSADDHYAQVRSDPRTVDLNILDNDDFNAESYLKLKMANSSEAELKNLQSSLQAAKNASSTDLQRSVIKNYAEFFTLAKEITTLENDLLELKSSLAEWKSMPSLLNNDDYTSTERHRSNRSSLADLKVLHANQITSLHSRIEGSSKFVPATPGRRIVTETANITALNSASYKPEQLVHFTLFDDALLLSKHRKRVHEAEDRLVASRCWNLADIFVLDIKDSSDLTNVFKIKDGKSTYVFRTSRGSEKRGLLASFREVSEELAARKRKQREDEHERRKTILVGNPPASGLAIPSWLADMQSDSRPQAMNTNTSESDVKAANELADNLTVLVAQRDWDEATSLVESGEESAKTIKTFSARLKPLKGALVKALLGALADPMNRKSQVVHISSLLIRLRAGVAARKTFLDTRASLLRKRIRMISFEGDTSVYISDLSNVVFTTVKHSADWYFGSFREHDNASAFVQWAKEQIKVYIDMFRMQVFHNDVDPNTVEECLHITRSQSKRFLGENGLDFSFLIDQVLSDEPMDGANGQYPLYRRRTSSAAARVNGVPVPIPPRPARNPSLPARSANRPISAADTTAVDIQVQPGGYI